MKDFVEMTADEIRNYKGPLYSYSMVCQSNQNPLEKVPFDGDHTSPEAREKTIREILKKWRLYPGYGVSVFERGRPQ